MTALVASFLVAIFAVLPIPVALLLGDARAYLRWRSDAQAEAQS